MGEKGERRVDFLSQFGEQRVMNPPTGMSMINSGLMKKVDAFLASIIFGYCHNLQEARLHSQCTAFQKEEGNRSVKEFREIRPKWHLPAPPPPSRPTPHKV